MNNERFYTALANLRPEPLRERTAAVLVLLWEGPRGPELVLEQRALTLRRQAGEICLPGGGVEPGEDPGAAVLRECAEELGLTRVRLLCHLESIRHATGERVEVFAGVTESLEGLRPEPDEVAQVFTLPLVWLRAQPRRTARYVLTPDYERSSPELHSMLPCYGRESSSPLWVWEDKVIWGLTARILERFLRRTEGIADGFDKL